MEYGAAFWPPLFYFIFAKKVKPKFKLFVPAIIWFCIIFYLLIMPSDDIPNFPFLELIYFDKWVHAGLFGGLVILTSFPFFKTKYASRSLYIQITIYAICYGVAMEYVQKYLTNGDRDFDILDMVADAAGAVIGLALINMWLKKQEKKTSA